VEGAIAVTSLAAIVPLTFGSQAAQAQGNPSLGSVNGFGRGEITCPDGSRNPSVLIGFSAQEEANGETVGTFRITTLSSQDLKTGVITESQVTPSRFTLEGFELEDMQCSPPGQAVPTTVTIRGQCDEGGTIQFRAANGQRGTFTIQDVTCARISN
jgi:hypothetical protein